jgi:hypothetical protein
MRSKAAFGLFGLVSCGLTHALGAPSCKPVLVVRDVSFSEMQAWRRTWTARISVDASRCAATSGRFDIDFVRLKEAGPDLEFREAFVWTPGEVEASTVFAADEAVRDYVIVAAPCSCRD